MSETKKILDQILIPDLADVVLSFFSRDTEYMTVLSGLYEYCEDIDDLSMGLVVSFYEREFNLVDLFILRIVEYDLWRWILPKICDEDHVELVEYALLMDCVSKKVIIFTHNMAALLESDTSAYRLIAKRVA